MSTHKAFIVVFVVLSFLFLGMGGFIAHGTQETITITVTDTERIVTGSGETLSSKYLVFTETETFENTDTLWFGKWNSSDLQGQLRPGKTYTVRVCGFRIPFLSSYRNIIEIK